MKDRHVRRGNKNGGTASLCREVHQGRDEPQSDKVEVQCRVLSMSSRRIQSARPAQLGKSSSYSLDAMNYSIFHDLVFLHPMFFLLFGMVSLEYPFFGPVYQFT